MTEPVDFTHEIAKAMYNLGSCMIWDDKGDLGYTTYYNRRSHKYHGKTAPHHPSPIHHYQLGSLLVILSQLFALGGLANDLKGVANDLKPPEGEV